MLSHIPDVHNACTFVNVDCVAAFADNPYVPDDETTGEALIRLRERAGLSMRQMAAQSGYAHASGIQRFLDPGYEKRLPIDIAEKMAAALAGRGAPPIEPGEVFALAGMPVPPNAQTFRMEGASEARMARDVPVYGTALGADQIVDGDAIEQTTLNTAETIAHFRRPVLLDGRSDIYGLYVQGSSMAPRFRDGATLFVEQRRSPKIGDDAVVYLRMPDEIEGERPSSVLIKTLTRKTANYVELEQYNPPLSFRLPAERILRMDRVVPWDELVD